MITMKRTLFVSVLMVCIYPSVHASNDLQTRIDKLLGMEKLPPVQQRTVIGTWFNNNNCNRSFERVGSKYYDVLRCQSEAEGATGGDTGTRIEKVGKATFKPVPIRKWGDHYVILGNGNLSIRDNDGEVEVLNKQANLRPSKQMVEGRHLAIKQHRENFVAGVPVEPGAVINDQVKGNMGVLGELVFKIRESGYKCNSISSVVPIVFGYGFKMSCDRFSHKYNIEDKGGHWKVTVQ